MPELAEARTIAGGLDKLLAGKTVRAVNLLRADMLKTGSEDELEGFVGRKCLKVATRGKYVVLHTKPLRLVIQLGMAGVLTVPSPDEQMIKHTHLTMDFTGKRQLRYRNTRRIASGLHILPGGDEDCGLLAALGPEATEINSDYLAEKFYNRNRAIKSALLDQSILAGLGNIYTDESLARAGISPLAKAGELSRKRVKILAESIREVLAQAIAAGGSTLGDANPYLDAEGKPGYFANKHIAYGMAGKPCKKCGTIMSGAVIGGRGSSWCPKCQK